jgi:phosphoribosylformimino-5-aminoimidazole carboxamide ribotide isomerase
MLIPSIDLRGGRVVQLVQGERLALESDDLDGWIRRFARFPIVHVIDLDAALGSGDNLALVHRAAAALAARVGGGVRTVGRAREVLAAGARQVIVGSALFRDGRPSLEAAAAFAGAIGADRIIAAVDARGGRVAVHGWQTLLPLSPEEAVRALEPYCAGFLYTHVDTEGLMQGTDLDAILAVRRATSKALAAAGGITTQAEIDRLHTLGIDAVVGMAIYTGRLALV